MLRVGVALVCLLVALPAAQAAQLEVAARNGVFDPERIEVQAGDTVLFVNRDDRPHTVTSAWDDGKALNVVLKPGQSVPVVFNEAGSYSIRCMPHSTLEGSEAQGMVIAVEVAGGAGAEESGQPPLRIAGMAALGLAALGLMVWTARARPLRRWLR